MSATQTLEDRTLLSTVQFSSTVQDADEDTHTTPGYFTVTRTGDTSNAIYVGYKISGGTATAGTDYTNLGSVVEIKAKESSAKIEVFALQDLNTSEGDETVELTLQGDGKGGMFYTLDSNTTEELTICNQWKVI